MGVPRFCDPGHGHSCGLADGSCLPPVAVSSIVVGKTRPLWPLPRASEGHPSHSVTSDWSSGGLGLGVRQHACVTSRTLRQRHVRLEQWRDGAGHHATCVCHVTDTSGTHEVGPGEGLTPQATQPSVDVPGLDGAVRKGICDWHGRELGLCLCHPGSNVADGSSSESLLHKSDSKCVPHANPDRPGAPCGAPHSGRPL